MATNLTKYKTGYKYQLVEDFEDKVSITPFEDVEDDFIRLTADGKILIKKGYAWDGPSGPTVDTKNFMRGSLVHDALYQLMRKERIDGEVWREKADDELKRMCLEDGMSKVRAWYVHRAVRIGAGPAADPSAQKEIFEAP